MTIGDFREDQARVLLTALGNLSLNARLGDGHTVDVSAVDGVRCELVELSLFSRIDSAGSLYGIYRVQPLPRSRGAP